MEKNLEPHKYPFAINEADGKPIYIEKLTKENKDLYSYRCFGCDAKLFPILGNIREHHFRHEKGCSCDPNRYLHEYAKGELKKRFDEEDSFIVKGNVKRVCNKAESCELKKQYNWPECEKEEFVTIDLKKLYDTCTSEKGYYQDLPDGNRKYIADLILTNSKDKTIPPVVLEVWVTHECTEDKKRNGGQIIEIKINKEEDAKRPIIESNDELLPIRFYNFIIKDLEPSRKFKHLKLQVTDPKHVSKVDETLCSEGLQFDPDAFCEVIFSQPDKLSVKHMDLLAVLCEEKRTPIKLTKYCRICEHAFNEDKKSFGFKCIYYNLYGNHCMYFKYSKQKGEAIKDEFKYPYWTQ
jgi:hypothetical protein